MAVYKVPQDVEAEDKLVGPFTLKQSIFLVVAIISGWLTYVLYNVNPALSIITLPLVIVFLILGVYRRPDQPVERYLASLLRFYLKPRTRIWDRDGILENVKITAPPKIEHSFTDGRSRDQVNSQLKGLASMMDTRGWSTKSANIQIPGQSVAPSDRLVSSQDLPSTMQPSEVHAADDMMDPRSNTNAQYMSQRSDDYQADYRQRALSSVRQPQNPIASNPTLSIDPNQSNAAQPGQSHTPATPAVKPAPEPAKQPPIDPQVQALANNHDLSVGTIARQAKQQRPSNLQDEEEISLR